MIEIISLGSKWKGQEKDSIDRLLELLKTHTIEERFFSKYGLNKEGNLDYNKESIVEWRNICPINDNYKNEIRKGEYRDSLPDGVYNFFGNFEEFSFVFNIVTDDKELIEKLVPAIKANKGWKLYYNKNKVHDTNNA